MDVSRALLLPDLLAPDDGVIKTLALYWDQVVMPDYQERLGIGVATDLHEQSEDLRKLVTEGVVHTASRTALLPEAPSAKQSLTALGPLNDPGSRRMAQALAPIIELLQQHGLPPTALKATRSLPLDQRQAAFAGFIERASAATTELYLNRLQDAFELARSHNLAPLGLSVMAHIGSLVGHYDEHVPTREAALLSASIQGFEVAADTPVEHICAFRERNRDLIGRFRASLVDLSGELRRDAEPSALLAAARDVHRNRVVPALGDLERALKESRLTFALRSLVGAASISLIPVAPIGSAEQGARLIGRTIDYRFSRERLLREHPYGYLHKVRKEFGSTEERPGEDPLGMAVRDPNDFIARRLRDPDVGPEIVRAFWLAEGALDAERPNAEDPA